MEEYPCTSCVLYDEIPILIEVYSGNDYWHVDKLTLNISDFSATLSGAIGSNPFMNRPCELDTAIKTPNYTMGVYFHKGFVYELPCIESSHKVSNSIDTRPHHIDYVMVRNSNRAIRIRKNGQNINAEYLENDARGNEAMSHTSMGITISLLMQYESSGQKFSREYIFS